MHVLPFLTEGGIMDDLKELSLSLRMCSPYDKKD